MLKNAVRKLFNKIGRLLFTDIILQDERTILVIGSLISNNISEKKLACIHDYEFKIFSQFGDDGLIQYLIRNIKI
jgi:hypothetical protein